jgi:hypothetical protein
MRTSRGGRAVLLVVTLASVVWLARPAAAAPPPNSSQLAGAPPGVLVLVRQLTWDQAAAAASGHGETLRAGLVSTLPADASLPDRVLSLAAGRPVDAGALEGAVAAQSDGGVAAADRMRAANPDASFGALAPTRVLASPGMTAAGLLAIGTAGAAPPADPLPAAGPLETVSRELLVIAVPDAAGLQDVLARVRAPGGARARVLVVGLESPPGRARTAPLLELGGRSTAVVTSDSTRRTGLVAFQDVRPTLTGSAVGTQGAPIRLVPRSDPPGFVGHLDRQVGALVSARTLAVVVYAVVGTLALAVCLAALLSARSTGWAAALAGPMRPLARALVLASLAMPSGYLIASAVAPTSWLAWLLLGLVASAILTLAATLAAWRRSSAPVFERPAPVAARRGSARATGAPAALGTTGETGWAAPALLGGLLTGLVVIDLLAGGGALSRPLLGNSAFDGERFYGLGNGYFAYALAGIFLVVAFGRPRAWVVAALLAGLAVVDGLPSLGADVGGALTAMLSAAAALLLLGRARPSLARIIWLAGAAVVAAGLVVVGVALVLGETTHGSRVAQDFGSDPGAALRAVGHQLSGNFGLLATNFWAWWGPLLVAFAGFASLRPPALLAGVPDWVLRAVGVGAIGSALLILLNDTGVTAAAGSGLALVVTLAWSALEPARAPDPAASRSAT